MAKGGAAASTGGGVRGRNSGVAGAGGKRGPTAAASADEEMKALVARHNKKFKPAAPAYVPTLSIRDTRKARLFFLLVCVAVAKHKGPSSCLTTLFIHLYFDAQWEEMTGRSYRALNYAERELANNEIKAMKLAEARDAGAAGAAGEAGNRRGR